MKTKALRYIGLIFFLVVIIRLIDFKEVKTILLSVSYVYIILAITGLLLLYITKTIRLYMLLNYKKIHYPFIKLLQILFISNFIGFITPGRIGELTKIVYLKQDNDIKVSSSFPIVLIDRFFDVYFLLLISLVGFYVFNIIHIQMLLLLLVCIVIMPVIFGNNQIFHYLNKMINKNNRGWVNYIFETYRNFVDLICPQIFIKGFISTSIAYLILFSQSYLIAKSIHLDTSLINIAWVVSIANCISYLPISVSGIGTRELSIVYFFNLMSINESIALSYSFLLFFVFNIIGGLIGVLMWFYKPIKIDEIKEYRKYLFIKKENQQ